MPRVSDVRYLTMIYNPNTLSLDAWDGSLTAGSLVIGAVTQSGTWTVGVNNFPASQAVTGTFWQATQPVSGPLTDAQLRATAVPVSLASVPSHPVTNAGTFAVQSAATLAAETTKVIGTVNLAPATLHVTAVSTANAAVTASLPAVAGQFHYITNITLQRSTAAALAGSAVLTHTTTNLPGSPAWTVGNAVAVGATQLDLNYSPATPLKSSVANTATTVVMPAGGAGIINRINVSYYTGA